MPQKIKTNTSECRRGLSYYQVLSIHKSTQKHQRKITALSWSEEQNAHTVQSAETSVSSLYQMVISLHPRTAVLTTATHYNNNKAHWQTGTTQNTLPFTYRTFGVSGAQPQNQSSQHAGYSQHLLVGDSGEGLRRPPSSSSLLLMPFLFSSSSSLSFSHSLSFSFPPSLSPRGLSSLC